MSAEFGFHFQAPGEAATTTHPGAPEADKNNGNILQRKRTRRAVIAGVSLAAIGAAVAGGNHIASLWDDDDTDDSQERQPEAIKTPGTTKERGDFEAVPRVFFGPDGEPLELRRDQITMPETLDPDTFPEAFANVAQGIQYFVNVGDIDGIRALVPGKANFDAMHPGQLEMRAAYINNYRTTYGTPQAEFNHREDPENYAKHYGWGFTMKLLEQTSAVGGDIARTSMVRGTVEMAIGDYRPKIDGHNRVWVIEKPRLITSNVILTRNTNLALGTPNKLGGWSIYQMDFPQIPPTIKNEPPKGFEKTPMLYPGLGL